RSRALTQCGALRGETDRLRNELSLAREQAQARGEESTRLAEELAHWKRGDAVSGLQAKNEALAGERDAACLEAEQAKSALKTALRRIEWFQRIRLGRTDSECVPIAKATEAARPERPPACPNLLRRHILCVGGRTNLVPGYRDVVRAANGIFSYH